MKRFAILAVLLVILVTTAASAAVAALPGTNAAACATPLANASATAVAAAVARPGRCATRPPQCPPAAIAARHRFNQLSQASSAAAGRGTR